MSFDLPYKQQTHSVDETEALGARLAQALLEDATLPRYIALRGDLGVGKTAFVRGFTRAIAPGALVRSPTFALVNEYRPTPRGKLPPVFHFDMYRITSEDDLYSIGYDDYLDRGICLVEWSENIPYALPDEYLRVTIEKCGVDTPDERIISVQLVQQ
ncbi:MAG: tRNA (adenosine(37)-N6)-threonylcarbamoyltransferase complex ATPase subunit type 1 TsaE [Clostridia bacterium]|nr:tRNA (adenosine(37)-N6)-threonylcarbamoyltransferase complex ATPase subunit type 1 TsaE [Clostridia bacterium]MBR5797787.1 tRNA (adenosine(37)-N6)-threonylcarbamoyltransferase complex ATPase subunit type 1 TsaE [Clostridia bacterium]